MDVLINNMGLPKEGSITITIRHDGVINFIGDMGSNLGRLVDCKAIELPPHGRLIEGDELADVLVQNLEPMLTIRGISGLQADVIREVVDAIVTMLRECPTVLEATE